MDLSIVHPDFRKDAMAVITRCIVDRIFFAEEVLKMTLEPWQKEVFTALDQGETRVSIRSGVGTGKTTMVSVMAVHFLLFRDDCKIIVTSPSFNQLQDGIIPEVRKWMARLPQWMQDQLEAISDRVTCKPEPANNFISFRTARKEQPDSLQGIHATHVLLLVDEASGVAENVFDAAAGTMSTAGAITVLISNPLRTSGLFFKTHRKLKHLWATWKVTSADSSQVASDFPKNMAATYGLNSSQYKIRVLAEFPEGSQGSVIPRGWVESAVGREILPSRRDCVWGLDPGRGGDATGFCELRGGNVITELAEVHNDNLMATVGWVKKRWDGLTDEDRPTNIFVDAIGMGAGVADRLLELGLPVVAINVAEVAAMSDRFVRLRAELWYSGREFFEGMACSISDAIADDVIEKFTEELSETADKEHSSGRYEVESKRDLKRRGLDSPNLADAFLLCLAEDGAVANGLKTDTTWGKQMKYSLAGVI